MNILNENIVKSSLFRNMEHQDIQSLLDVLNPITKTYQQGEVIIHPNQKTTKIGLILEGFVHICKDDYWGNHTILAEFEPGDAFGEVYAITNTPLANSVESITPSTICFIELQKILHLSTSNHAHQLFTSNLINELAHKNLLLFKKIDILSQKSTRKKILAYLTQLSIESQQSTFQIPFNRQELADYLCVDRSALSNELSKLRNEDYIDFKKNKFTLKHHEE